MSSPLPSDEYMIRLIKQWAQELLKTPAPVEVHSIPCADGHCPVDNLVLEVGQNKIVMHKPLLYIRRWDIQRLLEHYAL